MWYTFFTQINHFLTLGLILPALVILGLYLTIKLKGIQFTKLRLGIQHLTQKESDSEGDISNFEALAAVLAGNLGTGNISGIAIALATGGPGALVWMWVMALLGSVVKFAGCFLGFKYREKTPQGEYVGGPMYYLKKGLKKPLIATLFSLAALLTSLTVGNLVQVNSIILPLQKIGFSPLFILLPLVALVGFLLMGGLKRIAKLLGALVPLMTLIYLATALTILALHHQALAPALQLMFKAAFSPSAIIGGGLGYTFFQAVKSGFERGIFATDAGCGIAPILQSGARCKNPLLEGMVAMVAPIVVMLICTVTGLVLLVTQAPTLSGEMSTNMCTWAFTQGLKGHPIGAWVVVISLVLFAFTTIITWAYCGEKALEFLGNRKSIRAYKWFFIAVLPIGAFCKISFVWILADISIALMLITNIWGVFGLSKEVIEETNKSLSPTKPLI